VTQAKYSKYRHSGTTWFGQVPVHWRVIRLKAAATYRVSNVDKIPADNEEPVRLCNYTDVYYHEQVHPGLDLMRTTATIAEIRRFILQVGDVVITKDSEDWKDIAVPALVTASAPDFICGYHLAIVRPDKRQILGPFLMRVFQASGVNTQMQIAACGITRYSLPKSAIGEAIVPLPPIEEQVAITNFLDREIANIDDLIAAKTLLIDALSAKLQAIVDSAFVQGIDAAQLCATDTAGVNIPSHWKFMPLKRCLAQRSGAVKAGPFGSQLLSSEMISGEVKVYNQRTVIGKDFQIGENYITEEKYEQLKAFAVLPGDILVTTRGTIGRSIVVPDGAEPGILHPCLIRIQVNERVLLRKYLALLIETTTLFQRELKLFSNATTIEVIYSETLKRVRVPIPPLEEQGKILSFVEQQTTAIQLAADRTRKSCSLLAEHRSALISAAVTGQIDVRNYSPQEAHVSCQ